MKKVHILGGGTFSHVRSHLALATPAFGTAAREFKVALEGLLKSSPDMLFDIQLHLTKMADSSSNLVTNEDVSNLVDDLIADPETRIIFFNVALCDFHGTINEEESGKYAPRLKSREAAPTIQLSTADKILGRIRKERKDIFLIAFKTTAGADTQEQYIAGLNLLKENSANIVVANDLVTRRNMIIVPEEARYCTTRNRDKLMMWLAAITLNRSQNRFTRSEVVPGTSVPWDAQNVPEALLRVVNHCISRGAYKPFRGSTAGHFAFKVDDKTFITSKRKTNFNNLAEVGMVKVEAVDNEKVIAHGFKPSVGGQSQRIIFKEHEDVDCIVHFHCPRKDGSDVRHAFQFPNECGSHECGQTTSNGLVHYENGIKAVFLDNHGPNIVFNRNADPEKVIAFIEKNFDLSLKTGGPVELTHSN